MESCVITKSTTSKHIFCNTYVIKFRDLPRHVLYYIAPLTYLCINPFIMLLIAIDDVDSD